MEEKFEKTCACKGGTLGKFIQPIILHILSKESCNGYQLIKRIQGYSTFLDNKPDPTGTYRYLRLMETKGLVEKGGGVDSYQITEHGATCLANWKTTLREYRQSLGKLIEELQ